MAILQTSTSSICAFFDCFTLPRARKILAKMLIAAEAKSTCKKQSPARLLHFADMLEELLETVYCIVNNGEYNPGVLLDSFEQETLWMLTDYQLYCAGYNGQSPWDYFPRYLSKKEFLDPYRTLETFTRQQSIDCWKQTVRNILSHALSNQPITELNDELCMLHTAVSQHKMIEAAHLLAVRAEPEAVKIDFCKWKDHKPASVETSQKEETA
jgi:hypothetical protein